MIPEEKQDGPSASEESPRLEASRSVCKGSDTLEQTQHGRLQSCRARIHQQISKELRMRTGAENLYRATSNARVRETVALELSCVNSSLQLLKEELEELNCSVDTEGPGSEGITVPMIPLGLKETKELDWSAALTELISQHFGEDGTSYEAEIRELSDLRQAMRTPSRNESGLELLVAYYNQLCLLDARFVTPARSLGLLFHWYDSLTGVPAQQQALAFEKGSVLFNIGALHTQIGARQDRSCTEGTGRAAEAFQRAAGAFRLLRDKFSHAPSPDMSPTSLSALEQLMAAQAQECVFEGLLLPAPAAPQDGLAQLRLAQEAAQVAAQYEQVHGTMARPPVQDYVPFAWTTLVRVKAEHFRALAHYHAATALCDGSLAEAELLALEQVFEGPPAPSEPWHPLLPQEPEERRKLGKAHLKRAILGQEEALRLHAVCRTLRRVDLLQAVLGQALRRSLAKYSELDLEDDFFETTEAPDIQPRTNRRPEVRAPSFSRVKVTDIFQRLGPLSVFSVKNRWRLVGPVHVTRGEGGFGFTLRGDSPVLIAAVIPGGHAAAAGLREGDYIVSVNGQPCRWWKHTEVVAQLRAVGAEGVSLQVATLLPSAEPPGMVSPGAGRVSPCPWSSRPQTSTEAGVAAPSPVWPGLQLPVPQPPSGSEPLPWTRPQPSPAHTPGGSRQRHCSSAPQLSPTPVWHSCGDPTRWGCPHLNPRPPPDTPPPPPSRPLGQLRVGPGQGCRPLPVSVPTAGGPPTGPARASEKPEGVWLGDASTCEGQPQAPPGLESQGPARPTWRGAVPGPSSPCCSTLALQQPRGAVRAGLPTLPCPGAVSSWLAAGPPRFLPPQDLQASLLPPSAH